MSIQEGGKRVQAYAVCKVCNRDMSFEFKEYPNRRLYDIMWYECPKCKRKTPHRVSKAAIGGD